MSVRDSVAPASIPNTELNPTLRSVDTHGPAWMVQLMRKIFWIYLLQYVVTPFVWAQTPLTLERAEALYLARNPALQAVKDRIDAAGGRYQQAGVWPNPQLNFSEEGLPLGADDIGFFSDQEFIVWGTQRLELGGKRHHRKEVAQTGIEITRTDLKDFIRLGKAQVQEAYLLTDFSQKKASFSQEQLDSYYLIRETHQKRFEAGDVSGLSQMRIDLEELRFLSALNQARTDFNSAWSKLAALIGWTEPLPASLRWQSNEEALTLSLERLKELAVQTRPDLASFSFKETQKQQQVDLEKAQRIPDLTLGGGYKRDFGVNSFYASVTLPLPLFDRNQGSIHQAAADLRRARNQLLWKNLMIRSEVEKSYRNYQEQQSTVTRVKRDLLQRADTVLETTRTSYEEGESSLTDYLDALRVRLDVSLSFYDLLFQLERSRIQLEQAVGVEIR